MTNEEKIRQSTTGELSEILFDFFVGFHNQSIDGLCGVECYEGKYDCVSCISEWLKLENKQVELCINCRNRDGEWCVAYAKELKFLNLINCFHYDVSIYCMSFKEILNCNDNDKKKEAIDVLIQQVINDSKDNKKAHIKNRPDY